MRKQLWMVVALGIAVFFLAGCSMIGKKTENPIIGTWSGVYVLEGAEVIFEFSPENTMTCTVPDAPEYSFTADYAINMSAQPATVDLRNIDAGALPNACLGIVRFPGGDAMEFMGSFGQADQVSRPVEFSKYDEMPSIYIEFRKSDN